MNWQRATQIGLGLVVLVTAVLGLATSWFVVPMTGVAPQNPGGRILTVETGSPTWRDGIREGDRVLVLDNSHGGWFLRAAGTIEHVTSREDQVQDMRSAVPWSMLGIVLAGIAGLLAHRGHEAAAVVLPVALLLALQPAFLSGSSEASLLAGVILFVGAALAAVAFGRWRRVLAVPVTLGAALAAAWIVSSVAATEAFDLVDLARAPASAGFSVAGLAIVGDRRRIMAFLSGRSGPQFVDLLYLGLALAILIGGFLGNNPLPAIVVTVAAVLVYPFWRHATVSSFERLVASQARRDASIRAVEDERGRLAREIHDSPLQELSGVIRRLEAVPGAEHEADALRAVAGQLRDVATALHPPVLVDLGLAAAIEDLRDQLCAGSPVWEIAVDVDDLTTTGRPPAEVELAAYRVTQEAMANAIAHSGGRCIGVRGSVAPEAIDLAISDDGHGLGEQDARAARRAGHFGLDSIRERALAAGGTSVLTSTPEGVCVRFRWESRS